MEENRKDIKISERMGELAKKSGTWKSSGITKNQFRWYNINPFSKSINIRFRKSDWQRQLRWQSLS